MGLLRFQYLILLLIISALAVILIAIGPHYEAAADICLQPPENVRKTDFSWITVNEWFNSQGQIISSRKMIEKIEPGAAAAHLKNIVRARRLGAADVMRIYARGNKDPGSLIKLVDNVTIAYMKSLAQAECLAQESAGADNVTISATAQNDNIDDKKNMGSLYSTYALIERDIRKITERTEKNKARIQKLNSGIGGSAGIQAKKDYTEQQIISKSKRISELTAVYTDQWPEVSALNLQLAGMKKDMVSLEMDLETSKKNDKALDDVNAKISEDETRLVDLKKKLQSIDLQLSCNISSAPVKAAEQQIERKNLCGYGFIINPTSVSIFPFMHIHLALGIVIGLIVWLFINKSSKQ